MEAHVFDTHVRTEDGRYLHFDVLIARRDNALAMRYAGEWLARNGIHSANITQHECQFCHSENVSQYAARTIARQNYMIYPLQGCEAFQ